jgi:NTP pyrophosphatase (non-canonical NTP hydrolase)
MKEYLKKVQEFHDKFKLNDSQNYKKNPAIFALRYNLMREENEEYLDACEQKDDVQIADALGDQLYVLLGTIISHGLENKIELIFNEIHDSNMSKLGEDGQPIYNEAGKVQKGPNYHKPDLRVIVTELA